MASTHDGTSKATTEARTDPSPTPPDGGPTKPAEARLPSHRWRKWFVRMGLVVGLAVGVYYLKPQVETALNTVSTDDAYVNGHVTLIAPRVSGQVSRVLVDDNYRVKKGALLVQLDKEPFEDQVAVRKAAVTAAEAGLVAAQAEARVGGPGPRQSVPARPRYRRRSRPDRQSASRYCYTQEQAGQLGAGAEQPQARRGASAQRRHQQGGT